MSIDKNAQAWVAELLPFALANQERYGVSAVGQIADAAFEATDGDPDDPASWGTSAIAKACNNINGLNGYPEVLAVARVRELVDAQTPTLSHDTEQWHDGKMNPSPGETFLHFPDGQRGRSLEVWCMWGRGFFFPGKGGAYKANQADATDRAGFERFLTAMVKAGWCPTPGYVKGVMRLYDVLAPLVSASKGGKASTAPASKSAASGDVAALAKARQVMELIADDPTIPAEVVKATRAWRDALKAKVEGAK